LGGADLKTSGKAGLVSPKRKPSCDCVLDVLPLAVDSRRSQPPPVGLASARGPQGRGFQDLRGGTGKSIGARDENKRRRVCRRERLPIKDKTIEPRDVINTVRRYVHLSGGLKARNVTQTVK